VNAFLTPRGRDLEPQVRAVWQDLDRRTATNLSPEELAAFEVTLGKIIANLRDGDTTEAVC
jgi:DNA-binding MarR family transcriptional regulator